MPTLVIAKTYNDGNVLTEAQLDASNDSIATFINVTKLDDANIQTNSITTALIKVSAVTEPKLAANSVSTNKLIANSVTADKIAVVDSPVVGETKGIHTFDGILSVQRGWMKMNGDVVNMSNYDAQHGAGAYATDGVASSVIDGLNLPNVESGYLVGVSATTQDGSSPITNVGSSTNQINIQHSHTVNAHNHQLYDRRLGLNDEIWDVNGVKKQMASPASDSGIGIVASTAVTLHVANDLYTSNVSPGTNNQGSTTQSIQPNSVEVIYIIKVI